MLDLDCWYNAAASSLSASPQQRPGRMQAGITLNVSVARSSRAAIEHRSPLRTLPVDILAAANRDLSIMD